MRKLSIFNFVTLNGYFEAPGKDISWHQHGGEEEEFSSNSLKADNILLFGRVTYEMMASFWPTPMAIESIPEVAKRMNAADKIVFSRTLKQANWNNTTIIKDNMVEEVKKMKQTPGKDMTVLGSGSIITQFAEHGLIDEYQVMIDPVALGEGTPIFKGLGKKLELKLRNTKVFKSGVVLLCYKLQGQ